MKKSYLLSLIIALTFGFFILYANLPSDAQKYPSLEEIHADIFMPAPESPDGNNVSNQFSEQLSEFEQYLAENPEDTTHLLRIARLLQDGHRPSEAAGYYERLLKLNPGDRQSWLDLSNCFAAFGNWEKAEAATYDMLDEFPGDEEARYNLGAIYANTGKEKQAREIWNGLLDASNDEVARIAGESLALLNETPTLKDDPAK